MGRYKNLTDIKNSQCRISIHGDEGYSDGEWTIKVFNPIGDKIFEHTVSGSDNEKDLTFEEFIKQALDKFNALDFSIKPKPREFYIMPGDGSSLSEVHDTLKEAQAYYKEEFHHQLIKVREVIE